jgi:FMN phosphatase YigB (HAD superfamily)
MLRSLGEKPEYVLMVGDNPKNDVAGPRALGMEALLLDRTNQTPHSIRSLREIIRYV